MKNIDQWKETKWTLKDGQLVPHKIHSSSRYIAGLQAAAYQAAFEKYASGKIADLGCGEVPMYMLYKEVDPDPFCVDWGDSQHDVKHADEVADLNSAGYVDGLNDMDTVCAWDVLEHLWNPVMFFALVKDALIQGGHFIAACPFMYWIHEAPHDYHRYTEYGLRKYCETSGLEVVECKPYGDCKDVLIDISCKTGFGQLTPPVTKTHLFPIGYTLVARKS